MNLEEPSFFIEERSNIVAEINQFLSMVLSYCVHIETDDDFHYTQKDIASTIGENLQSLIESLCLIHALYGYPELKSSANTDDYDEKAVDKNAVKDLLVDKKSSLIVLVNYCKELEAANDEFWQFKFSNGTSNLDDSLREPAQIFLEMVRDMFCNNVAFASIIGRTFLQSLPDVNFLKPVVWAECKTKPEFYGVSLGVRSFVRPLYLYIKLSQLRNGDDNGVQLGRDVIALQSVDRSKTFDTEKASEYDKKVDPCKSCQIFFGQLNERSDKSSPPFGNCAEYDVIQRATDLKNLLKLGIRSTLWGAFKSACEKHFKAFNDMHTDLLREPGNRFEIIKAYHAKARDAKPKELKYKWSGRRRSYQLVAK